MLALAAALGFGLIFASALTRERRLMRAQAACSSGALEGCQKACRALDEAACAKVRTLAARSARATSIGPGRPARPVPRVNLWPSWSTVLP